MTAHTVPPQSSALYAEVSEKQVEYWHDLKNFRVLHIEDENLQQYIAHLRFTADCLCDDHAQRHHEHLVGVWRQLLVGLYAYQCEPLYPSDRQHVARLISLCIKFNSVLG